jgi:hypothetical protein
LIRRAIYGPCTECEPFHHHSPLPADDPARALHARLRIRNVLTDQELEDLNSALDTNEDMDSVCDRTQDNAYGGGMSGHLRGSRNNMLADYPEPWVTPFRHLIADDRLEPYL